MRQEKIKCKVRERKRVKEHSMKRGEEEGGGGGKVATTKGATLLSPVLHSPLTSAEHYIPFPLRRAPCCVVQLCLVLNLLKRMSLLITP